MLIDTAFSAQYRPLLQLLELLPLLHPADPDHCIRRFHYHEKKLIYNSIDHDCTLRLSHYG